MLGLYDLAIWHTADYCGAGPVRQLKVVHPQYPTTVWVSLNTSKLLVIVFVCSRYPHWSLRPLPGRSRGHSGISTSAATLAVKLALSVLLVASSNSSHGCQWFEGEAETGEIDYCLYSQDANLSLSHLHPQSHQ